MNLALIQAAIVSNSARGPCRLLRDWLDSSRLDWWVSSQEKGIDLVRNQVVTRFLREDAPRGKKYLLSINGDHVPAIDTHPILREEGDLLWCGDVGHWGSAGHFGEDTFGCGCFRASAGLLSRMPMPWFQTRTNDCDRNQTWKDLQQKNPEDSPPSTKRLECECRYFARRARKVGATPRMVGIVGNQQGGDDGCILFPDPKSTPPWKLAFPGDIDRSGYEKT